VAQGRSLIIELVGRSVRELVTYKELKSNDNS